MCAIDFCPSRWQHSSVTVLLEFDSLQKKTCFTVLFLSQNLVCFSGTCECCTADLAKNQRASQILLFLIKIKSQRSFRNGFSISRLRRCVSVPSVNESDSRTTGSPLRNNLLRGPITGLHTTGFSNFWGQVGFQRSVKINVDVAALQRLKPDLTD